MPDIDAPVLHAIDAEILAGGIERLLKNEVSAEVTKEALPLFDQFFGIAEGVGTQMVVRHVEALEDTEFISASSVSLSRDLLERLS